MSAGKVDVVAIKARCEAATAGEWRARRHGPKAISITAGVPGRDLLIVADVHCDDAAHGGTDGKPDAEFIAAARTDVPLLCDALEVERAKVSRLNEAIRLWGHTGRTDHLTEAVEPEGE